MKASIFSTAILALFTTAALAQTSTPTPTTAPPTIHDRKVDQQNRIAQGVKSGQLTAGETAHLERKEAGINHEERIMRSQDNGHLTGADRKAINQQQNKVSRQIYRDKHNAPRR